eukprot:CAMPEP_0194167520 /NCGR_PEP_ID=MMETSP0154-20130528/2774_1 /TAXON_ID=1049557 /ORGANISM="Thalassiothrix antarctica, Strain L6-D1" /LENGTH=939 /DNA_ID=CAMNT_0038878445 /DNA_START=14 /DNA_END=2833 /DNA_ORIENTATION=-
MMEFTPITFLFFLILTIIVGDKMSKTPLESLGRRPMGHDLWSWFLNFIFNDNEYYILGYDSSLGAWSPLIRVMLHICISGIIVSSILGPIGLLIYGAFCFYIHNILPNVSHPGGPRSRKIQRVPKFSDSVPNLPAKDISSWRCFVAQSSHDETLSKFEGVPGMQITGESCGRQIWSTVSHVSAEAKMKVDEEFVKKLAAGGREPEGFNPSQNPNSCDKIFRAQQIRKFLNDGNIAPNLQSKPKSVKEAARKAGQFYSMLQTEDGHWAGDYGGPHFLMPGLIVAWYVMGKPENMLDQDQTKMMRHYISVHQQTDGGWGTHIESPSTIFGTTLMYVALRLLGVDKHDERCQKGRAFMEQFGGAVMTGSWAKFYLCLLGAMEWDGHNSVPCEMFLLPNWFPFHPGRLWCHCRMVYLPMSYLYGSGFVYSEAETDPTILSLREELYIQDYKKIPWKKTRHMVAGLDNYSPITLVMRVLQNILARYERWSILQPFKNYVRSKGLKFAFEYMEAEDLQTNFIDIGPVNKVLNMLSMYHASGNNIADQRVVRHFMRVPDYLWLAEDGMKMQGYNGSQCWDTSFAIQAFEEAGLLDEFPEVSSKCWAFLERTQILSTKTSQSSAAYEFESVENRDKYYRHLSQGGWPFSTSAHGWPISDCTGEGLKASLCLLHHSKTIKERLKAKKLLPISEKRLQDAVNICLTYQNEDGGFATYENNRGFGWYEFLNPSEVFGAIMIDYSYVECSMATLTALADFHQYYPAHRSAEIQHAIMKGRKFLKSIQQPDGSWYGSWACCFCYGCWFGIEGLIKTGENEDSPNIKRACNFLLSHQRENGGWGEDFTSCYDKDYAEKGMGAYGDKGSGVVNTSWALLALSAAKCDNKEAIKRGIKYLMKRQLPSGDFPQEGISGVFNHACGITYTAYRNVFPLWAFGRCVATYGEILDGKLD